MMNKANYCFFLGIVFSINYKDLKIYFCFKYFIYLILRFNRKCFTVMAIKYKFYFDFFFVRLYCAQVSISVAIYLKKVGIFSHYFSLNSLRISNEKTFEINEEVCEKILKLIRGILKFINLEIF